MKTLSFIIFWFSILVSLPCFSETEPTSSSVSERTVSTLPEFDLSFSFAASIGDSSDVKTKSGSMVLGGVYHLGERWTIDATWGLSFVDLESAPLKSSKISSGNPLLGASFFLAGSEKWRIKTALYFGVPLATFPGGIDNNRMTELNYRATAVSRGWRDPFLWETNTVPIISRTEFRTNLSETIELQISTSPAFLISVNQRPSRFALNTQTSLSWNLGLVKPRTGWSYLFVGIPLETNHHHQHAVWLGADIGNSLYSIVADVNLNLGTPYGLGSASTIPAIGVMLGGRGRF